MRAGKIADQGKALEGKIADQGKALHAKSDNQGKSLRAEISLLTQEVRGLRERMARMEGLLEGLREAITGKQAA